MKKLACIAALAAGAIVATAAAAQDHPVKVGIIFPQSGGAGSQGRHVIQAIESMADIINGEGGVLGREIELVTRDDESTPAIGVSRANELIGEGVEVIIEGWNSPVTLAMQPVINRADILDIAVFSSADTILSGEGNPLAVRLNSSNAQNGVVTAQYIADQGFRRIAFLTENDAYGMARTRQSRTGSTLWGTTTKSWPRKSFRSNSPTSGCLWQTLRPQIPT
jgi:branched-chain amino acid transport system substrate-binding protein